MSESTTDKLVRLRRSYLEALPEKLGAVEASLKAAQGSEVLVAVAFTDVHKLKGSTGSYGYEALSARLAEVHELLYDCVEEKRPPTDEQWRHIDALLVAARAAIPAVPP